MSVQGGPSGASRGVMVGFGNNNTLINNGSIVASGVSVRGISVPNLGSTGTNVTNAGSIVTSGSSGHGIAVNGPGNRVTNTGSVDVSGTDAKGRFDPRVGSQFQRHRRGRRRARQHDQR
ncbi:hypothetical protein G6F22_019509 [Rhizopus arrhizus]|nr:hypothetical protein G6F22_019509 [Rhizopus arrhizus]